MNKIQCCPQITFGIGCPKHITGPLPLNIFTVGLTTNSITPTVVTKFDDNITSLEWCQTDGGALHYLLVGSESNDWDLNAFCGGNEIAVYKALIICRARPVVGAPHVLLSRRFLQAPTPPTPPKPPTPPTPSLFGTSCLCVHKECRRFPTQADITNVLTWNPVPQAVSYNIYTFPILSDFFVAPMDQLKQRIKFLILIATIDANCPLVFRHHCLQKCVKINYLLTATNTAGIESPIAIITI